jgi:hypothetical protein
MRREHPIHTQYDADRLFDWPRNRDFDILDRQARCLRDDDDARKGDFGINAAGHLTDRNQAGDRQKRCDQNDQAKIGSCPGDQIDAAAGGGFIGNHEWRRRHRTASRPTKQWNGESIEVTCLPVWQF